jgi:hypothetical protein
LKIAEQLKDPNLTDWQRSILAAELSNSAVTWVSTQDLYLENSIETQMVGFSHYQVCNRLREHALLSYVKVPQIGQAPRAAQAPEIQQSFEVFARAESKFKSRIYFEIEDKRPRLMEVREGILRRMLTLESLKKPYLKTYILEHRALLDRLDRYLNHDRIIDDQLQVLHEQVARLSEDSKVWQDAEFIKKLGQENACN